MPAVRKNESKKEYIARAVPIIMREHPGKTPTQAAGQAAGMYDQAKKKRRRLLKG